MSIRGYKKKNSLSKKMRDTNEKSPLKTSTFVFFSLLFSSFYLPFLLFNFIVLLLLLALALLLPFWLFNDSEFIDLMSFSNCSCVFLSLSMSSFISLKKINRK